MKPNNILSMAYLFILIILISACATVAQRTTTTPTPTPIPATIPKLTATTNPTLTPIPATTPKLTATTTATPSPLASTNTSPATNPNPDSYLEITLNKANLAPPVRELVYLTIDDSPDPTFDSLSRIWRADVTNISQATPILTLTHSLEAFPVGITLSPDNKFLVYGRHINQRTGLMAIFLFNLDNDTVEQIDTDVIRQANAYTFLWAKDGQIVIYTKVAKDWSTSALHAYSRQTGQAQ